jgi:CRP/FNR family cyclic AMP-dependent transcriptional regulator
MLAFIDLPGYLQVLDERSRRCGAQLAEALGPALAAHQVAAGEDVALAPADGLLFVESGCLKWQEGPRLVRLYNDGDWITTGPEGAGHGATATSDFATSARSIERSAFQALVQADPALAALWDEYRASQQRILLGIAGALAREDLAPNTRMVRHQRDAVIVTEGAPANEVFVLLEGSASVRVQGNVVGAIAEGEVFGEISFLTGQPRSATVVATSPCLVQVIDREQFAVMVRANPQLMVHVATTLATRVVELNGKLHARPR